MYEAINKRVVVEKSKQEQATNSGIILTNEVSIYTVVATTEETKELQGRDIVFTQSKKLAGGYESVDIDDITAVCVV